MLSWFYSFERFILITNKKVVKALDLKTIYSDFNEEKLSYMLISSWFYSLTFNFLKKMIYDTNDRLKFTIQEEKRLLMIEEGDEDAKNIKEDP